MMKINIIFRLITFSLILVSYSYSITRAEVKIIEASENIVYLSQKVAKNYLLYSLYNGKIDKKDVLNSSLNILSTNLRTIAMRTKDVSSKNILEFLAYTKEQIEEVVKEKNTSESSALILDYTEALLEGATSISNLYINKMSKEEEMLTIHNKLIYLLERISKYYIALNDGFNDETNQEQMQISIDNFETYLVQINQYKYPYNLKKDISGINKSWKKTKLFFTKLDKIFIPILFLNSTSYIGDSLSKLSLYHNQNQ